MMPTGPDYGGYTAIPKMPEVTPMPVDFVIIGSAWGKRTNGTFGINKKIDIRRRIHYGFYQHVGTWQEQANVWIKNAQEMGAQATFLDWERSTYSALASRPGWNAQRAYNSIQKVGDVLQIPSGIYSNFNDYVEFFRPFVPEHADIPLWIAWPDNRPEYNSPDWDSWWAKTRRPVGDYVFEQFTWKEDAREYGAINGKKDMDYNLFNGSMAELDDFLGLAPVIPDPLIPSEDFIKGYNTRGDEFHVYIENTRK
jgi:hypothetical protein